MQTMEERFVAKLKWQAMSIPSCGNCKKSDKCSKGTLCSNWIGDKAKIEKENNDEEKE